MNPSWNSRVARAHVMATLAGNPVLSRRVQPRRTVESSFREPQERAALQLMANGKANSEIAGSLRIRECDVELHLAMLFARMGVTSRTEAIAAAWRRGLLTRSDELIATGTLRAPYHKLVREDRTMGLKSHGVHRNDAG